MSMSKYLQRIYLMVNVKTLPFVKKKKKMRHIGILASDANKEKKIKCLLNKKGDKHVIFNKGHGYGHRKC